MTRQQRRQTKRTEAKKVVNSLPIGRKAKRKAIKEIVNGL